MNIQAIVLRALCALVLSLAAGSPACSDEHAKEHADPLVLDAQAQQQAGIEVAQAGTRAQAEELKAPGEVRANAYATVLVAPRVAAHVLARKAKLGDVVKAGDPLVVLSSVEVAETQGALIVAEQDWQRIAALGAQAVSARRYNEARVARDQAQAKLRAYGLSDGQIQALLRKGSAAADGSFELLAPAAGRIASDEFIVGERVDAGRTLFTLVKEDSVWVQAHLAPAEAARVHEGDAAHITAHGISLPGTVVQRSHLTDERTRTAAVRIAVDNRDDALHPGELVQARIAVGTGTAVLMVPSESIVLLQNQPTVFVAHGGNRFAAQAVATGDTREGWTTIEHGLQPGDAYVRRGAFVLKARLLRSQLGDHH